MKKAIRAWFGHRFSTVQSNASGTGFTSAISAVVESLEGRTLFASVGPQVATIVADNRGQVKLTFTQELKASTVNVNTVRILTAGADGKLDTADDVSVSLTAAQIQYGQKTLYVTANTAANKLYRIQLLSSGIKGTNGRALYGNTGAGGKGGNFDEETTAANFIAHFNTPAGEIQVTLDSNTPVTNQNFVNYANAGAWDGTFIHRNASAVDATTLAVTKSHFIIQAGGFRVNNGLFDTVPASAPILNEPLNSNLKYTIAMAKLGGNPDSATNQFFFNLADNSANLDNQNGGFTAFGNVTNAPSKAVVDALDNNYAVGPASSAHFFTATNTSSGLLPSANGSGGTGLFDNLPVQSISTINAAGNLSALRDAVILYRVSFLMSILPTVQAGIISPAIVKKASAAIASTVTFSSVPVAATPAATGGSILTAASRKDVWA